MESLNCPRCGAQSYERFRSYTYCAQCNYSSEYELLEEEKETLRTVVRGLELTPKRFKGFAQKIWLPEVPLAQSAIRSEKLLKSWADVSPTTEPCSAAWAN